METFTASADEIDFIPKGLDSIAVGNAHGNVIQLFPTLKGSYVRTGDKQSRRHRSAFWYK